MGTRLKVAVVRGSFMSVLVNHYGEQISPNKNLDEILDELVRIYYMLATAHRFDITPEELEEFYDGQTATEIGAGSGQGATGVGRQAGPQSPSG